MKIIRLLVLLVSSGFLYAQDYHYKIKIDGVTNLASAKQATSVFRHEFEDFPIFDDVNDCFDFISSSQVDQNTLEVLLTPYGYTILEFYRILILEEDEEK